MLASEIKTLRIMRALRSEQRLDIAVSTFLGAHVVPPEYRREKTARCVRRISGARDGCRVVARTGLADFCDVFCDRGAFTVPQARTLLSAAGCACGLKPRLHAEQLARTGATGSQ